MGFGNTLPGQMLCHYPSLHEQGIGFVIFASAVSPSEYSQMSSVQQCQHIIAVKVHQAKDDAEEECAVLMCIPLLILQRSGGC
jgi:hypothetical protein